MGMHIVDLPRTMLVEVQKPFHEVVIETLVEADENRLREIAWWLMRTTLPHGTHERVQKAWFGRCYAIKFDDHTLITSVTAHLLEREKLVARSAAQLGREMERIVE